MNYLYTQRKFEWDSTNNNVEEGMGESRGN